MTRGKKEQFKNTMKLFYITSISFDYCFDEWLFYQASKTFNISPRTAKKYFYQLVPKDVIKKYIESFEENEYLDLTTTE